MLIINLGQLSEEELSCLKDFFLPHGRYLAKVIYSSHHFAASSVITEGQEATSLLLFIFILTLLRKDDSFAGFLSTV